ncbi:zinc-ribbon domain-containing protein [Aurantimicrobium minutum]|nr:hypothetical protein [Aurantimicrobium minutum]
MPKISGKVWEDRAAALNLQWVDNPPHRNDVLTRVRCLDCGNEWEVFPANIAKGRKSCNPCARLNSRVHVDEWQRRIDLVQAEWVDQTPETLSDKSKFARCLLCGSTWKADPRKISKTGHPRCPSKRTQDEKQIAAWKQLAITANIEWIDIPRNSHSKTLARCLICRHEWEANPGNLKQGSRCPLCANKNRSFPGKKISPEEWNERAKAAGIRWSKGVPDKASTKTEATCLKCSYTWFPTPSNINKGSGCPSCSGNLQVPQAIWDERAAAENLRWLEDVKGRHTKTKAQCIECGFVWEANPGSVSQGAGCPVCKEVIRRGKRLLSPEIWNDRASKAGLEWIEAPTNNSEKKSARCLTCNYVWKVIPSTIARGSGCPVCSGVIVPDGEWDKRAKLAEIEWLEQPIKARSKYLARCLNCNLTWKTTPTQIKSGSSCPACAETGFNDGQPGLFYFVERNNDFGRAARKIGITNISASKGRLRLWEKQGFQLKKQVVHHNGSVVHELERRVLFWLRNDLMLPPYLDKEEMPKGGETETFSPDEPSDFILIQQIDFFLDQIIEEIEKQY